MLYQLVEFGSVVWCDYKIAISSLLIETVCSPRMTGLNSIFLMSHVESCDTAFDQLSTGEDILHLVFKYLNSVFRL